MKRFVRVAPAALVLLATLVGSGGTATACDLCAVYTGHMLAQEARGLSLSLSSQYTSFNTLKNGGRSVANPAGERLQSSITQLVATWRFDPRWSVAVALPYIDRDFRSSGGEGPENGSISGIGDVTVFAQWTPVAVTRSWGLLRLGLLGGLKLPTGDSDLLADEADEHHEEEDHGAHGAASFAGAGRSRPRHGDEVHGSGLHGHDLALGSGSTDLLVGASAWWSLERWFVDAMVQYMVRNEGDFDYEYDNDLHARVTPGVFLLTEHENTLALGLRTLLATKGTDDQAGARVGDSAQTVVWLGPELSWTGGTRFNASLGATWPVVRNASALQLVPDFRVVAAAGVRF